MKGGYFKKEQNNKMAKNNLVLVVVVALVVAVATSVATVNLTREDISLTGETVRVAGSDVYITSEVYNKAEIDAKLNNVNATSCSKDGVCEMQSLIKKTCANLITAPELTRVTNMMAQQGEKVVLKEGDILNRRDHVLLPKRGILKLDTVFNSSSSVAGDGDSVTFVRVLGGTSPIGTTYTTRSTTTEGSASVTIDGHDYTVRYWGPVTNSDAINVTLDYPETSSATNKKIDLSLCF